LDQLSGLVDDLGTSDSRLKYQSPHTHDQLRIQEEIRQEQKKHQGALNVPKSPRWMRKIKRSLEKTGLRESREDKQARKRRKEQEEKEFMELSSQFEQQESQRTPSERDSQEGSRRGGPEEWMHRAKEAFKEMIKQTGLYESGKEREDKQRQLKRDDERRWQSEKEFEDLQHEYERQKQEAKAQGKPEPSQPDRLMDAEWNAQAY
ncbi:hypothetical protein, partial [Herbaspirillum sp. RV1423]|uniref:hypothetical protein n=1 Tax=Herbaspirillum sp. RV1423 TaxID=1443993 RepID=UPI0018CC7B9F